jgi:hypothetical protein
LLRGCERRPFRGYNAHAPLDDPAGRDDPVGRASHGSTLRVSAFGRSDERCPTLITWQSWQYNFGPSARIDLGGLVKNDAIVIAAAPSRLGTRQRLAYALLLYTGQRVGDVVKMRLADISADGIHVVQQKTVDALAASVLPSILFAN